MKKLALFFCGLIIANLALFSQDDLAQNKKTKDTLKVYKMPGLNVISDKETFKQSPLPVAEISASEITKHYVYQDIPELISDLPNVYSYSQNGNGIGYSTLSIRGFDQRRIAVYVNGIPQNDPEDHNVYWIDFPDIASNTESIEVQRGAGLSTYGSASIGGSINLTTSNFINKKGIKIFTGLGLQQFEKNDNQFSQNISKYSIEASSGLFSSDNNSIYAVYARLSKINSSGYRENSWSKLNSYFLGAVRFDEKVTTQINVFGGPISDGLAYNGLPKAYIDDAELRTKNLNYWNYDSTGRTVEYEQSRRKREIEEFSQPHFELLNDWNISENFTLKSSAFYYSGQGFYDYDGTGWTDASSFQLNDANGFKDAKDPQNPLIRAFVDNNQWGWIPRLIYQTNKFTWTNGLELRFHRSNHWGKLSYAEDLPSNYDPDFKFYEYNGSRNIFSVFSSIHSKITNNLDLFADAHLVSHSYGLDNEKSGKFFTKYLNYKSEVIGNGKELFRINHIFFNPKVGINYLINSNSALLAFVAITSREPRMSNLYSASEAFYGKKPQFQSKMDQNGNILYNFSKPLVKPETMFDFEIGYNFQNMFGKFNVNLYYMQYEDELVKTGQLDILGDPIDGNAPRTLHSGLEISGLLHLFKSADYGELDIIGNLSVSRNMIIEYDFPIGKDEIISLKDNPIAGFPDLLANFRINYTLGEFFCSAIVKYIGSSKTDNFGDMLTTNGKLKEFLSYGYYTDNNLEAYTLLNMDFTYKFNNLLGLESILMQLKVNNLLNLNYASGAEGKEFYPGAERNIFFGIGLDL